MKKPLGDAVADTLKKVGVKPCGGCQKRREALNRMFPGVTSEQPPDFDFRPSQSELEYDIPHVDTVEQNRLRAEQYPGIWPEETPKHYRKRMGKYPGLQRGESISDYKRRKAIEEPAA